MNRMDIFYQDKENCKIPVSHLMDNITDPSLIAIDELYGAADALSIQNSQKHTRILLALSIVGTLLTIAFLLYDTVELYSVILACVVFILFLFIIHKIANRLDCHRKYLEYRVLAESLRVQFFLSISRINASVIDILPWFIKMGIPWVEDVLLSLPDVNVGEGQSILDCWVRDQRAYHEDALRRAETKKRRDERITHIVLFITIFAYIGTVIFEFYVYSNPYSEFNTVMIRMLLKIVLGTMSAVTLFTGSYYGKMALSNRIDDHKRMIALYQKAEDDILRDGETEELLIYLAREFLIENSTWYAYQNNNKPDIVI